MASEIFFIPLTVRQVSNSFKATVELEMWMLYNEQNVSSMCTLTLVKFNPVGPIS